VGIFFGMKRFVALPSVQVILSRTWRGDWTDWPQTGWRLAMGHLLLR
jgi:hypothetical protein